jgi:hypothetical protein
MANGSIFAVLTISLVSDSDIFLGKIGAVLTIAIQVVPPTRLTQLLM